MAAREETIKKLCFYLEISLDNTIYWNLYSTSVR